MLWLILALVVLVVLAVWATWTAMRIERLDARVDAAWQALDAALVRRAMALGEIAGGSPAGDASARATVHGAVDADRSHRAEAENRVSAVIAALPPAALDEQLREACARVQIARTFYNDGVRAANALRAQRLPRVLRLGQKAAVPPYFDIDDDPGANRAP